MLIFNSSLLDLFQAFQQQAQELVALETIVLQTLGEYRMYCTDCTHFLLGCIFMVSTVNMFNINIIRGGTHTHTPKSLQLLLTCAAWGWLFLICNILHFFLLINKSKPYLTVILLLIFFILGCRFWNNSWSSAHRCCAMFPASARYYTAHISSPVTSK